MTVTLLSPQSDISAFGIRLLSSYLRANGIPTRLIFLPDIRFDQEAGDTEVYRYSDRVLGQIADLCEDSTLIGISLFSCHFDRAVQITAFLKQRLQAPIVWGGIHPTAAPEFTLRHHELICVGEGEDALLQLARRVAEGRDYGDVPGLWLSRDGQVLKNPPMALQADLDRLPHPDYSLADHHVFDREKDTILPMDAELLTRFLFKDPRSGRPAYQTMVTRGCPHSCSYCFTFKDIYRGQRYLRQRSAEDVIAELTDIRRRFPQIGAVLVSDDSFFALPEEQIRRFSELYREKIALPLRCLGSPATVTERKLRYLVDAGLFQIQMGIETASENTRKIYNRHIPERKVLDAVTAINAFKGRLVPYYDFITDNPYERKEDFLATLRFATRIPRPYRIQVFSLIFFPGTRLFARALDEGLIREDELLAVFRKQWSFEQETYPNFMLHLLNFPLPRFIYAALLAKAAVRLLDRPAVGRLAYRLLRSHSRRKARRGRSLAPAGAQPPVSRSGSGR